jgi:hypothetical protein
MQEATVRLTDVFARLELMAEFEAWCRSSPAAATKISLQSIFSHQILAIRA